MVLSTLESMPWRTASELASVLGYDPNRTIARLLRKGSIRRRVSDRHLRPYEYALAGQVRRA